MSFDDVVRPFRWDIAKRSQLGGLPKVEFPEIYAGFEEDLLRCCARVTAFCGDSDIVFVGRSPDSLFDLLSGLLYDTSWRGRLSRFDVSMAYGVADEHEHEFHAISRYFEHLELSPKLLVARPRPVALVDFVAKGRTFGILLDLLHRFSLRDGVEWRAVARQVRLIGLTERTKTSPNTWRWQQHAEWVGTLRPRSIKNVAVDERLWTYLAEEQPKITHGYPAPWWGEPSYNEPPRHDDARTALAFAVHLFDLGRERNTRLDFARELARQPQMTESWLRSLVLEIKR
jgi:hypothetical protein